MRKRDSIKMIKFPVVDLKWTAKLNGLLELSSCPHILLWNAVCKYCYKFPQR